MDKLMVGAQCLINTISSWPLDKSVLLFFLFLNRNICCGYPKELSQ